MTMFDKFYELKGNTGNNYWSNRIISQIGYGLKLSAVNENKYNARIENVIDYICTDVEKNGVITTPAAKKGEEMLAFLSPIAKELKVICTSHAHIDMNWMWGYQETAAATIETFRTVLDLMKEFPEFYFSQSQASVYKIVEENNPEMLEEIKKRVHEGRWELTASTWVEADRNMPNGESMARHILYTKRYLSKLFNIDPCSLQIDFEPDTFGHNWNVPEVLNKGGVKYYYHCRGFNGADVYKWQARSGNSVIVFRDPNWYNDTIKYDMMEDVPQFCKKNGIDVMLRVYGVGDHGGGPTRRDIEFLSDMMTWPVMPTIKLGTYREFFCLLEKYEDNLPVVNQELNFVFNGCYTSQSRLKMANRISEDKLYMAETICAAASVLSGKSYCGSFSNAWENVLFNQFHDILPGSGTIETREYSMGLFQRVMATANTNTMNALRVISQNIDTSSILFEVDNNSTSVGAGVGYCVQQKSGFKFPQTERGNGKVRVFHIFNPTCFHREAPVEISVWDWNYDLNRISVRDANGASAQWQIIKGSTEYWGHKYFSILIKASVPAFGYATYILSEGSLHELPVMRKFNPRVDDYSDDDIVLENDKVKATFHRETMRLISFTDKASGKETVSKSKPSASFRYVMENNSYNMTAWRVGQVMKVTDLNDECNIKIEKYSLTGIRKWVNYSMKFKNSKINVIVALDDNSSTLKFGIEVDWHEVGSRESGIPQLNFYVPLEGSIEKYRYDIPFGTVDRDGRTYDMPGNSFVAGLTEDNKPIMVVTDTKYGFRTANDSIAVSLIRSSYDPDPYPEYGVHTINIGLAIAEDSCNKTLSKIRSEFIYALPYISGKKHGGSLPLTGSAFKLCGDCLVSGIKTAEDSKDGRTAIIRLYDVNGKGSVGKLEFEKSISKAYIVDVNETKQGELQIDNNSVAVPIPAYEIVTVAVEF